MSEEKDIAVTMYHREHARWNQWAVFFFGSISALFILYSKVNGILSLWALFLICTILSLMWVLVALSIRASTDAWRKTIAEFDDNENSGKAFAIFAKKLEEFPRFRDLKETVQLWTWEPYIRVTRLLTLLGIVSAVFFFVLLLRAL